MKRGCRVEAMQSDDVGMGKGGMDSDFTTRCVRELGRGIFFSDASEVVRDGNVDILER